MRIIFLGIGFLLSNLFANGQVDSRTVMMKELNLSNVRASICPVYLRLWIGHKQVLDICNCNSRTEFELVSYTQRMKGLKYGKVFLRRDFINIDSSYSIIDKIVGEANEISSLDSGYNELVPYTNFEIELKFQDEYYRRAVPKASSSLIQLIDFLRERFNLDARYDNFFESLPSGDYSDGNVVITKQR